MKLTTLFLIAVYLHVSAAGYGQKVTLSGKDLPLEKVFSMVKKQTGYVFFYDYSIFQGTKNVTVDIRNADIDEVMSTCLQGQDLDYSIANKTISIVKKEKKYITINTDKGKIITAQGIVYNEAGQPLSGATVTIKEIQKSTLTNGIGEFSFSGVPENSTLRITFIGYSPIQISAKEGSIIKVYLSTAVNELDQAVVQAYGTTTKRLTTSNIGVVTAKEIERQPVMNPLLALQGKIAGLDVSQTSGYASAPVKVELRGRSSIGLTNQTFPSDPLYIIDGVPLTVLEVGGQSNYQIGSTGFLQNGSLAGPANGQSPLFSINPLDIESIEVLKDADATAIYGSRGANGVILINTKKGKQGKTKFDLRVQQGISKVTRFYDLLDTRQYLKMRREAFANDYSYYGPVPGISIPDEGNAFDLLTWDTTRNTNWQKAMFGKTAKTTDAEASMSGGDAKTIFRLAAGFNHSTNILTVDGADQRASFSLNLSHKSLDGKFNANFSGNYSVAQSNMISLPIGGAILPPDAPGIYDSVGNLNFVGWGGASQNAAARNLFPFSNLKEPYSSKTDFLNSNLTLSYMLIKGLKLLTSLGYNTAQANQQNFLTIVSQDPLYSPTGSAYFGYNNNKNWIIEPQITYDAVLGKGSLSTLVGASLQKNITDGVFVGGYGYTSDDLIKNISSAPTQITTDSYAEYKYAALFGNLTYSWDNKYILHISGRRDGSSRFGAGRQFGNFGALGAAWIFTEENWIKSNIKFLSFGKLRGSYGTTGSDAVGDYQYLTRWSSTGILPYGGLTPLVPTQHANPSFQWEVNKKLEGAIDLGFLKDRIHMSIVYYRNRVGNQLVNYPISEFTGFNTVTTNSPALVQNTGWEFTGGAKIVHGGKFDFSVNFNLSINRNKLISFPNIDQTPYVGRFVVGQSLNIVRLLHFIGVDPQTGQYSFQDKNHDGVISFDYSGRTIDDRYIYNLSPDFFGGIGMNFSYKQLQLNMFFSFKRQIGMNAIKQGSYPGIINNQPVTVLQRWQNPGDIAKVARFTTLPGTSDNDYNQFSDGGYTDASFIRLSNLALSYNLPASYVNKLGMQGWNIFLNANNLFLITKYKGIDPESMNLSGLPPTKAIVGGISFTF